LKGLASASGSGSGGWLTFRLFSGRFSNFIVHFFDLKESDLVLFFRFLRIRESAELVDEDRLFLFGDFDWDTHVEKLVAEDVGLTFDECCLDFLGHDVWACDVWFWFATGCKGEVLPSPKQIRLRAEIGELDRHVFFFDLEVHASGEDEFDNLVFLVAVSFHHHFALNAHDEVVWASEHPDARRHERNADERNTVSSHVDHALEGSITESGLTAGDSVLPRLLGIRGEEESEATDVTAILGRQSEDGVVERIFVDAGSSGVDDVGGHPLEITSECREVSVTGGRITKEAEFFGIGGEAVSEQLEQGAFKGALGDVVFKDFIGHVELRHDLLGREADLVSRRLATLGLSQADTGSGNVERTATETDFRDFILRSRHEHTTHRADEGWVIDDHLEELVLLSGVEKATGSEFAQAEVSLFSVFLADEPVFKKLENFHVNRGDLWIAIDFPSVTRIKKHLNQCPIPFATSWAHQAGQSWWFCPRQG